MLYQYNNIYKKKKKYKQKTKKTVTTVATVQPGIVATILNLKKKRKKKKARQSVTTFTQQVSQHFHKIFIFSCSWSQFHILLFYFDLLAIDTSIIVKIL